MSWCKSSDSDVQGKESVILDEYMKTVNTVALSYSDDCVVYVGLSTHSGKCFFDNWESSMVGDSCLHRDKDGLGGDAIEPCTYNAVTGLVHAMSEEK
jgi:hypothetical protein